MMVDKSSDEIQKPCVSDLDATNMLTGGMFLILLTFGLSILPPAAVCYLLMVRKMALGLVDGIWTLSHSIDLPAA